MLSATGSSLSTLTIGSSSGVGGGSSEGEIHAFLFDDVLVVSSFIKSHEGKVNNKTLINPNFFKIDEDESFMFAPLYWINKNVTQQQLVSFGVDVTLTEKGKKVWDPMACCIVCTGLFIWLKLCILNWFICSNSFICF